MICMKSVKIRAEPIALLSLVQFQLPTLFGRAYHLDNYSRYTAATPNSSNEGCTTVKVILASRKVKLQDSTIEIAQLLATSAGPTMVKALENVI